MGRKTQETWSQLLLDSQNPFQGENDLECKTGFLLHGKLDESCKESSKVVGVMGGQGCRQRVQSSECVGGEPAETVPFQNGALHASV